MNVSFLELVSSLILNKLLSFFQTYFRARHLMPNISCVVCERNQILVQNFSIQSLGLCPAKNKSCRQALLCVVLNNYFSVFHFYNKIAVLILNKLHNFIMVKFFQHGSRLLPIIFINMRELEIITIFPAGIPIFSDSFFCSLRKAKAFRTHAQKYHANEKLRSARACHRGC